MRLNRRAELRPAREPASLRETEAKLREPRLDRNPSSNPFSDPGKTIRQKSDLAEE
jgi:hypothetical protein